MFVAKIYIVWKSSKGRKEIYGIFNSEAVAKYNAEVWQRKAEARSPDFKINFRVKEETIYGESEPIICTK